VTRPTEALGGAIEEDALTRIMDRSRPHTLGTLDPLGGHFLHFVSTSL